VPSPSDQIEQLRATRGWRDHDVALGPLVESLAARARRTERKLGAFIDLWEQMVSGELAGRTRVTAIRGGVVHVAADSASTVYELDRMLRGGLEQEIRRRYQATLTRIKVTVGRV
jgi:predicted nucleic acid-binding Zn ribbon protein